MVEIVLLGIQDTDGRAVVLGFGQELLGPGRIALAVAWRRPSKRTAIPSGNARRRPERIGDRRTPAAGSPPGSAPSEKPGGPSGSAIGPCLVFSGSRGSRRASSSIALTAPKASMLVALHGQLVGEMILPGHDAFDAGVGVRHGDEAQLRDLGFALAGIAVGRLAPGGSRRSCVSTHELVGLALAGTCKGRFDELDERIGDRFLRHDAGIAGGKREMRPAKPATGAFSAISDRGVPSAVIDAMPWRRPICRAASSRPSA